MTVSTPDPAQADLAVESPEVATGDPAVDATPPVQEPVVAPAAPVADTDPVPDAQDGAPPTPTVAGLCELCFPYGVPVGVETVGCEHGSWVVALP